MLSRGSPVEVGRDYRNAELEDVPSTDFSCVLRSGSSLGATALECSSLDKEARTGRAPIFFRQRVATSRYQGWKPRPSGSERKPCASGKPRAAFIEKGTVGNRSTRQFSKRRPHVARYPGNVRFRPKGRLAGCFFVLHCTMPVTPDRKPRIARNPSERLLTFHKPSRSVGATSATSSERRRAARL